MPQKCEETTEAMSTVCFSKRSEKLRILILRNQWHLRLGNSIFYNIKKIPAKIPCF